MRTTINLPESLVELTKITATKGQTTMRELVIQGLERILAEEAPPQTNPSALQRLRDGYALGNQPLTRDETYAL